MASFKLTQRNITKRIVEMYLFLTLFPLLHCFQPPKPVDPLPQVEAPYDLNRNKDGSYFDINGYRQCITEHRNTPPRILHTVNNYYEGTKCEVEDFQLIRLLGAGGTAKVYLALFRETKVVALKILRTRYLHEMRDVFANEECSMANIHHPVTPKFYCAVAAPRFKAIAMEYIDGFDGIDHMRENMISQMPSDLWLDILTTSAEFISFLHSNRMVLRDYKPDNILITKGSLEVRIIDLGFMAPLKGFGKIAGTVEYMPPEYVPLMLTNDQKGEWTAEADWYALGVSMYVFNTGCSLFRQNLNPGRLLQAIADGLPSSLLPKGPVGTLIGGLIRKDPRKRWNVNLIEAWLLRHVIEPQYLDYPSPPDFLKDGELTKESEKKVRHRRARKNWKHLRGLRIKH